MLLPDLQYLEEIFVPSVFPTFLLKIAKEEDHHEYTRLYALTALKKLKADIGLENFKGFLEGSSQELSFAVVDLAEFLEERPSIDYLIESMTQFYEKADNSVVPNRILQLINKMGPEEIYSSLGKLYDKKRYRDLNFDFQEAFHEVIRPEFKNAYFDGIQNRHDSLFYGSIKGFVTFANRQEFLNALNKLCEFQLSEHDFNSRRYRLKSAYHSELKPQGYNPPQKRLAA